MAMASSWSAPGSSLLQTSPSVSFPSSSAARNTLTVNPLRFHHCHRLSLHSGKAFSIIAYASSSNNNNNGNNGGFDQLASRIMDAARSVGQRTSKFIESQNLQERILQSLAIANQKLEEFRYDARKSAQEFDRQYRVLERAQELLDYANEQARSVDQQFGLVQKFRNASLDFRRNWPSYKRQIEKFLQTPVGQTFTTLLFLWFLLSGWLFRLILLSMWLLPFAPLLINSAAKNLIIEGTCPSCKMRFIGNRNQTVVCNYCRAVVWQPRQDFSTKDQSDPSVIDIDID